MSAVGSPTIRKPSGLRMWPAQVFSLRGSVLLLAQIVVIAAAVGIWELLYLAKIATADTLPSPGQVGSELWTLIGTSAYWTSVLHTFSSWGIGLAISFVIAIPLGVFLGASPIAYRASRGSIDFVRTLPSVALIPVVALLYGATAKAVLVLVVFATLWPLLLQTMYGIRGVDSLQRDTARSYQLTRLQEARFVWLPSALPYICTGLRIASTMSLLITIGAELIAGAPGLGASIGTAEAGYQTTTMYAFIFTAALLGVILTAALLQVERQLLSWHPSYRKAD